MPVTRFIVIFGQLTGFDSRFFPLLLQKFRLMSVSN